MLSNSPIATETYGTQLTRWPREGRHILAHYDDETIIVYQAYSAAIADHAVKTQKFGGDFSFTRMSWIKPNFLWMMYRCGWATKQNQERVLALRIGRAFFDDILKSAVASSFVASGLQSQDEWRAAIARSDVRLQWDPDHGPDGEPVERRAIQLGLRGQTLANFAGIELRQVIDMTAYVVEQRERLQSVNSSALILPIERIYRPRDAAASANVGLAIE